MALSTPIPGAARLVLASASPRRRAIVAALGVAFDAVDVAVDEQPQPGEAPLDLATRLATAKAKAGARRFPGAVVLGADTVVALDGESLGKPVDAAEARAMLERLRGRDHAVITGVAAARHAPGDPSAPMVWTTTAMTRVWMRPYTDEEIARYVASGDPFDKAGGYAIQHAGFHPVAQLDGCYLNVVGLPLPETRIMLGRAGARLPLVRRDVVLGLCPGCTDLSRFDAG